MKTPNSLLAALVCLGCGPSDGNTTSETLAVDSMLPPATGAPTDAGMSPFRAVGQEPGWLLIIDDSLRLQWDYDAHRLAVATPRVETANGERTLEFTHDDTAFVIRIRNTPCADAMSGHQYPATVTVQIAARVLDGCGGDIGLLVRGVEWSVDSLDGQPLVPGSNITMLFASDSRVTGTAGCNRYRGRYQMRGNELVVRETASTRMACSPEVDRQEVRFLEVIGHPLRFHVESNALHLMRNNTNVVIARRR